MFFLFYVVAFIVAVVALMLAVSLVPTVLYAVVFAYLWSTSGSLLVATVYHSAFDEVRDTLQEAVGFGTLAENWAGCGADHTGSTTVVEGAVEHTVTRPRDRFGFWISTLTAITTAVTFVLAVLTLPKSGPFCAEDCLA